MPGTEPSPDPALVNPLAAFRLDGQVALITGASSGIGARSASVLHSLGAHVVLAARRADRLAALASTLDRCHTICCDLSVAGAAGQLVDEAVDASGGIDIVVASAGISNTVPAIRETPEEFAGLVTLDLISVFELAQAAALHMRARGKGGSLIAVASSAAFRSSPHGPAAAYTAAKTGLVGLCRELAVQWARYGIRVNALCPGLYPSEITEPLSRDRAMKESYVAHIPLRRMARSDELDGAVAFLASPASSYVTGHALVVDGGGSL
jgi:NAD(P)-dependent dehydrogenase (short-subunit alcohol dehydrogenase family)